MVKRKRISAIILCTVIFFSIISLLTGCNDNKKYDVTIKVKNNYGMTWIFTPDVSELYYEFEYTGAEMTFKVDSYNLPKHPLFKDKWLNPSGENGFRASHLFTGVDGGQSETNVVCEKGDYIFSWRAIATSDLWNTRTVTLKISVK